MAGAKPGVHIVQLKRVSIPPFMIQGHKFLKWDEDSGSGVGNPVTLRVDPNGFFLYWENQNKEVDLLDISTIRDTRAGKGARIPKDPKLRQMVMIGQQDTLEEKTLTIVSGPDFTNLNYINFCSNSKDTAKLWADELLGISYNLLQLNGPVMSFLTKIHTKLSILTDKSGNIPLKTIIKTFAQNKEDRKRVEKALDATGLPSTKSESISPSKFSFEEFFTFYKNLTSRPEVERVFTEFSSPNKKKLMSAEEFMEFINREQRDPRLNEILYPYTTPERARSLIDIYEPNAFNAGRGLLSLDGFLRYMLSEDNLVVSMERYDLSDDMTHPLSHYFINSSHNTYLTGHQLTGKSSVEMYRQSLLAGCRCVELDFWNGRNEEPIILHGYTLVPEISAKDVFEAIAESAFKTSDYPVVLSFENHCNTKQQAKIAQYCREYFGSMLLDSPIENYPLEAGVELPPPSLLLRRIIIKNKKKHHHHHHHHKPKPVKKLSKAALPENGETPTTPVQPLLLKEDSRDIPQSTPSTTPQSTPQSQPTPLDSEDPPPGVDDGGSSSSSDDDEDSAEPDDLKNIEKSQTDKGTAGKESVAGAEISALVNYVQPVHFYSFEHAKQRKKNYEMSSFDEKQAMSLLKERPVEFVNYNKFQLTRVYPKGTRVDSTNFMPQLFWNAGCQLVALNYQTLDLAMQLNIGIFEQNKRCGYLLKPEFMRRKDRKFDPFAENTVDGIIAGAVHVKVISGQFLTDKRVGTYVEVEMYGLPTDTIKKRFRTKTVALNGLNPLFDEEAFVFKKVVLPDLACLRIAAYEEGGKLLGHRVLPVVGLRPGYRHMLLRSEGGQPLYSSLFIHLVVRDYVPDGLSDLAEALANPIKYQSEQEKRERQLIILQDDSNIDDSSANEESCEGSLHSSTNTNNIVLNPMTSGNSTPAPDSLLPPTSSSSKFTRNASLLKRGGERSEGAASPPSNTPYFPPGKSDSFDERQKLGIMTPVGGTGPNSFGGESGYINTAAVDIQTEPLEKFWDMKSIREKRGELEKKIEVLRKKHEKDRKGAKPPKKSHQKLVKRISSKNLETTMLTKDVPPTQSLAVEQLLIEKDTMERGYDEVFSAVEKAVKTAQTHQMKYLQALEDKDKQEVMKKISNRRKDEFRKLSKKTKEKNELDRLKREVTNNLVELGVTEREKLEKVYQKFRLNLEQSHLDIFKKLNEKKTQTYESIEDDFKERLKIIRKSEDDDSNNSKSSLLGLDQAHSTAL